MWLTGLCGYFQATLGDCRSVPCPPRRVALDAAASQVALPPPPPLPGTTANAEEIPLDDEEGGEAGGASGGARAVNADADAGGVSGAVGEEEFPLPDPGEFLANAEEIDIGDEEEGDGDGDGGGGAEVLEPLAGAGPWGRPHVTGDPYKYY